MGSSAKAARSYYNLYWQPADGSGDAELLLGSLDSHLIPGSWHPSGRFLAFHQIPQPNNADLMILPMEGSDAAGWKPGKPTVFLQTPASEQVPTFSPDGRWIAYSRTKLAATKCTCGRFLGPGGKWQLSTARRHVPDLVSQRPGVVLRDARINTSWWSATASREFDSRRQADPVDQRRRLQRPVSIAGSPSTPTGDRFAVGKQPETESKSRVVFIFNFFDELRRLAPAPSNTHRSARVLVLLGLLTSTSQ